MKKGWLINDCLTCISGTKTFWHDLLDWLPNLQDKTDGFTQASKIVKKIEELVNIESNPDYIIRNASYFNHINIKTYVISLLQDIIKNSMQYKVLDKSNIIVVPSLYMYEQYKGKYQSKLRLIPLGIDFDLFKPLQNRKLLEKELGILPNSILFVGSSKNYPKGFNIVLDLIKNTNYNFCLVMKDDYKIIHNRVKVFNKVSHKDLLKIYNACSLLICTSKVETQHLAGLEAAACNLPIIATDVGIYYSRESGIWGEKVNNYDFISKIKKVFNNLNYYSPREYFLKRDYDTQSCKKKWLNLVSMFLK